MGYWFCGELDSRGKVGLELGFGVERVTREEGVDENVARRRRHRLGRAYVDLEWIACEYLFRDQATTMR